MTVGLSALSVGPAASRALSTPGARLRLHSVFPSTLNLAVEGVDILVTLTGPRSCFPHAVALERTIDFPGLPLAAGDCGRVFPEALHLQGPRGGLVVALGQASRHQERVLPRIARRGDAWRASARCLDDFQLHSCCDLRLGALLTGSEAATPFAEALQHSARALGRAAEGGQGPSEKLTHAVSRLVGAGSGLTPSGDDFLSGFMAASRMSGSPALVSSVADAITMNLAATGEISASLLRCAVAGLWPTPLADLADSLGRDETPAALRALHDLCGLGHSSGADIATGFLFGVACLLKEPG